MWSKLFNRTSFQEFSNKPLKKIFGKIPNDLHGSYLKNTVACLNRNGERLGHWFDGDGAILDVTFKNGDAIGSYKFVETDCFVKESEKNKFIFPTLGKLAPNLLDRYFSSATPVHKANTSVMCLEDKLFALWEGGAPYTLNYNLETIKLETFDGKIGPTMNFSAHHKIDPETGNIYNFGRVIDKKELIFYCNNKKGELIKMKTVKIKDLPINLHDLLLAGNYLILPIFPFNFDPISYLLRLKPYVDCFSFNPKGMSKFEIFDKNTFEHVKTVETDPMYSFHFSNGYVDSQGNIVFDWVEYNDSGQWDFAKEVVSGSIKDSNSKGKLTRYIINPKTGLVVSKNEIYDKYSEYPVVDQRFVGKMNDATYLSASENSKSLTNILTKVDHVNNRVCERRFQKENYLTESLYIRGSDKGYVVSDVYDGEKDVTRIHLMDENNLEDIAVLELPSTIALGFHGQYRNLL